MSKNELRRNRVYFKDINGELHKEMIISDGNKELKIEMFHTPFFENMSKERIEEYKKSLPLTVG